MRKKIIKMPLWVLVVAVIAAPTSFAESSNGDWSSYGSSPASTKYAPLDQINKDTVKNLGLSWVWNSVDNEAIKTRPKLMPTAYKSTPIKVGDVLYTSTSLGSVVALDAASGEQIWVFDTKTWADGRPANIGFNHRGVSYYEKGDVKRILMGTNNAFLWSLDAATGKPDPAFGSGGKIDLTIGLGRPIIRALYSNTAAPMIVGDVVVMGAVVQDSPAYGFRTKKRSMMPPGHVRGFDVITGEDRKSVG